MNLTALLLQALASRGADEVRLYAAVGRMIANRLRAIEMWNQPPEYLGYPEVVRWQDAYPANPDSHLTEYAYAPPTVDFVADRLVPALDAGGALATLLADKQEVGGYVAVMIANYLIDRQTDNDPVGYRVFANLEAVVEELAAEGVVEVTGRQERRGRPGAIRRTTAIRFVNPTGAARFETPVVELVLAADSLRGSVHKLAKCGVGAQRLLRPAVEALPAAGVESFTFGELLNPLQRAVREQARLWAEGATPLPVEAQSADGEIIPKKSRIVARGASYTTLDEHLGTILPAIRAAIDAGGYQERTRSHLHRVLTDWFEHLSETNADGDGTPTLEEWARRLGVKKSTLWDHLQQLRGVIERVLDRAGDGR